MITLNNLLSTLNNELKLITILHFNENTSNTKKNLKKILKQKTPQYNQIDFYLKQFYEIKIINENNDLTDLGKKAQNISKLGIIWLSRNEGYTLNSFIGKNVQGEGLGLELITNLYYNKESSIDSSLKQSHLDRLQTHNIITATSSGYKLTDKGIYFKEDFYDKAKEIFTKNTKIRHPTETEVQLAMQNYESQDTNKNSKQAKRRKQEIITYLKDKQANIKQISKHLGLTRSSITKYLLELKTNKKVNSTNNSSYTTNLTQ